VQGEHSNFFAGDPGQFTERVRVKRCVQSVAIEEKQVPRERAVDAVGREREVRQRRPQVSGRMPAIVRREPLCGRAETPATCRRLAVLRPDERLPTSPECSTVRSTASRQTTVSSSTGLPYIGSTATVRSASRAVAAAKELGPPGQSSTVLPTNSVDWTPNIRGTPRPSVR